MGYLIPDSKEGKLFQFISCFKLRALDKEETF